MFVVTVKYMKPLEDVDRVLAAHRAFLDEYYKSGHLICSGPQNPREGGVIICNASSRQEVEDIFSNDPYKKEQIGEYTITEFNPVKYAPGFEQFAKGK